MRRRRFRASIVVLLLVLRQPVLPPVHAGESGTEAPLRLVGEVDGRDVTALAIEDGLLVERGPGGTAPLPRGVRWRLDGDLRTNARWIEINPTHAIHTVDLPPSLSGLETTRVAILLLERDGQWSPHDFEGAVVVFAWIVDGAPRRVMPVVASRIGGASTHWSAAAALELDAETRRGFPVALVWRAGAWVEPEPQFKADASNLALHELAFGSPDAFTRALAAIPRRDSKSKRDLRTLMGVAASIGSAPAVRSLLDAGVDVRRDPRPLNYAAVAGRDEIGPILIAAGASAEAEDHSDRSAFDHAIAKGHLPVAMALRAKKPARVLGDLLDLALAQDDRSAVDALCADPRTPKASSLEPSVWVNTVEAGYPDLVHAFLQDGMKARTQHNGRPLLLRAAARGTVDVVRALLKAGAPVDQVGTEARITPLMMAAMHADPTVAEVLLDAGASVQLKDRRGNTALSYALAWQRPAVADLLRARGAMGDEPVELPEEARRLRAWWISGTDAGAAVVPANATDRPPIPTHAPPVVIPVDIGDPVRRDPVYSTVPVARPLEPGSPIVMMPRVDFIPTGQAHPVPAAHWVLVSLIVEPDGIPSCVRAVDRSTRAASLIACEAVKDYRFAPGEKNGVPVRTRMFLAVTSKP